MSTTPTAQTDRPAPPTNAVDRYFKITERGSTIGTEIRGGLVTFFTMSYIIVLNPLIIGTVRSGRTDRSSAAVTSRTWRPSPRRPRWSRA